MTLEGKQLGRYQIVRLLGAGGMGEVYLAEDPRIHQQVAIKVIRAEQTPNVQSAQTAARLSQREARAIVALDDPRILPLNDYGEELQGKTSLIYLVMPYRAEGSLVDWVQQQCPGRILPPEVVAHLVGQAAEAIQHAHDHQIIHMDVKPSNFLIRANPKTPDRPDLLLADFGIARIASATASTSQVIRGTPTYMAPEQCEGEAVPASDQYALAVMAYELLTGRPPFQGAAMRIMYQHVNILPEPPSAYNTRLSKAVDEALLTALAKRPEERFESVTAFAATFTNAVQALEVGEAATLVSVTQAPTISGTLPDTPLISATMADAVTQITPPAPAGTPGVSGPMSEGAAALSADAMPADLHSTPTLPDAPASPASAAPSVPGAPAGPQAAAPAVPAAPAGAQSGTLAAHGVKPLAGAGKGVAQGLLPKLLGLKLVAAVLVTAVVITGGVAGVVLAQHSRTPSSSRSITSSPPASSLSATVTITPASDDLKNTFTVSAVTGTSDSNQVGARLLSLTTPAQSKTVNATGQGTIPGTHASGIACVDNFDTNNSITLQNGSVYPNTLGTVDIHMVLDATVTVPAAPSSTTWSQRCIPAHILEIGSIGNNGFNNNQNGTLSYSVFNNPKFSNGKDPQTYTAVQQSDIDNAASALESANRPDPQQVFQGQIQSNEQLVNAPQCTPRVTSNHQAGDEATQVTVTVSFTCTGEVYDHDGASAMAANLLTQQAAANPGAGYALVGKITTAVTNATPGAQNTVKLTVSAQGVWAYQFSEAQKQTLAQLIAGKSLQEAQQLLTSQRGVLSATIHISGGNGQSLPSDPSKIKIVVQTAAGT